MRAPSDACVGYRRASHAPIASSTSPRRFGGQALVLGMRPLPSCSRTWTSTSFGWRAPPCTPGSLRHWQVLRSSIWHGRTPAHAGALRPWFSRCCSAGWSARCSFQPSPRKAQLASPHRRLGSNGISASSHRTSSAWCSPSQNCLRPGRPTRTLQISWRLRSRFWTCLSHSPRMAWAPGPPAWRRRHAAPMRSSTCFWLLPASPRTPNCQRGSCWRQCAGGRWSPRWLLPMLLWKLGSRRCSGVNLVRGGGCAIWSLARRCNWQRSGCRWSVPRQPTSRRCTWLRRSRRSTSSSTSAWPSCPSPSRRRWLRLPRTWFWVLHRWTPLPLPRPSTGS
mmetsp:Transcript_23511/g.58534  ORF Transcript_23511/g.58534 Transcript_23511/m.58534 type:complete len:335 (+) Transcript_23511:707-1711(+)